MSESEVAATLFTQGAKLAKALTSEECKQLLSGEAKLALAPRGHRVIEHTLILDKALKVLQKLGPEASQQIEDGQANLALVPRGHRVIEHTAILDKALKALQKLTPEELQQIEGGQAKLAVLRKGEKITKPFDPAEVAQAVIRFTTEGEIVRYLDADSSLSAPNLKKVATALNLPLPATVKTKQAIQSYIAENVVRDRNRWSLR
jgi:hypothetical protein